MPTKKNKKELSVQSPLRSEREKKQNRLIIIGFIITAALIVGLTGYALIYEFLIKNRTPVAVVNGVKIDNKYFQERVRLERYSYIQQYQSMSAQYQFFAGDETTAQFFQNQLSQMRQVLDDYEFFGQTVLNSIIDEELVAQQAEKLGIQVSDAEVDQALQEMFAYFPYGTPTPQAIPTNVPTPTLSGTQETLLRSMDLQQDTDIEPVEESPQSEEPAYTATEETVATATYEMGLSDFEGSDSTKEVVTTPTSTTGSSTTATPIPTATPYTEDLYRDNLKRFLNDIKLAGISEKSLRRYMRSYMLNQKMRDEIVKDVPMTAEQVWARHILVESSAEAQIVLARLNKGEDWAKIASEVSLDTSNKDQGGDLGWFPRGRMVSEFEEVAFKMKVGEISDPIKTQYGWHVIQVIGHDTLPLSSSDYQRAQNEAFSNWLNQIREDSEIVINDIWKEIVPTQPILPF